MLCATIVYLFLGVVSGKSIENLHRDVTTQYGKVRGYIVNGTQYAYLGIPYAAPPVGANRFKAPLPPTKWDGVYEANRTVRCPQEGDGDEDCLILNIFTPLDQKNASVLVYIHGGSFIMGNGQTKGADALIKNNIIVVTINYRLGALGFLCLGIENAPGNAGMKDQVAALRWVQDNIYQFGGNPNNVTIHGMSAGAASVELLVLSKVTKGLFKQAIIESASSIPVWVIDLNPLQTAYNLANTLKFNQTDNLTELLDNYKSVPHKNLSLANMNYYNNLIDGTFGLVPCVENNSTTEAPFLTELPRQTLINGNFHKVPIMFIFASSEGLFLRSSEYYEQDYKDKMETNFASFLPADLIFDNEKIRNETAKEVKHFYFGDKSVGDDTLVGYLNYFGDSLVLHGLLNSVDAHTKTGTNVYLMEFSYKGNLGSYDEFYKDINEAGHGDFVKYAIVNKAVDNEGDGMTVERVSKLISNFVQSGNPTPESSSLLPIIWPVVKENQTRYLLLGNDMKILENPYRDRRQLWDHLYNKFSGSV